MDSTHALRYHRHGPAAEVLQLEAVAVPEPGPGQVRLRLLASPLHPSDLGMIAGTYGKLRTLPALAGREAVATVEAVGPAVANVAPGAVVRVPEALGVWQEFLLAEAAGLWTVPAGLDPLQAAQAWVNPPTAWRLLHDFPVRPGEWIVQNAANSAVGLAVLQLAQSLGLKTINLVRRAELIDPLREMGGDLVLLDDDTYPKQLRDLIGGGRVALALNSVGGESALRLTKALADGGVHVTFGAMSFESVRFPTRQLIFQGLTLTGFWMDRWWREHSRGEGEAMMAELFSRLADGRLRLPVESVYPLSAFAEALLHAARPRLGKILFTGPRP